MIAPLIVAALVSGLDTLAVINAEKRAHHGNADVSHWLRRASRRSLVTFTLSFQFTSAATIRRAITATITARRLDVHLALPVPQREQKPS